MTQQAVNQLLQEAPAFMPEEPRPLMRSLSPPGPFPVEALGTILGPAAEGICELIQAPLEICAQSVLAAATLVVQAHGDVRLPMGQIKPLSVYFMSLAETGERKSACDAEAIKAITDHEKTLSADYAQEKKVWAKQNAAWEAQRAQILKDRKKHSSFEEKRDGLEGIGEQPLSPLVPLLMCPEPTYEGLCRYFMNGLPSIGLFSSEGGQFIGGHGMGADEKLKTSAALSDLWEGNSIKRVRAGDGTIILAGKRLSMHLMLQPRVARLFLCDPLLANQGFLSRMLLVAPESKIGMRLYRPASPQSLSGITIYQNHLLSLLKQPLPLAEGQRNELQPRVLLLAPQAEQVWIGFSDHVEKLMGVGEVLEPVRAMVNKSAQHAARLAGVLTLVKDIHGREIELEEMKAGIALASFYMDEALRLFNVGAVDPKLLLAEKFLKWLLVTWEKAYISLPDIYQGGIYAIRNKEEAEQVVSILEEHGWLVKVPRRMLLEGKFRRDVWKIVRGESR